MLVSLSFTKEFSWGQIDHWGLNPIRKGSLLYLRVSTFLFQRKCSMLTLFFFPDFNWTSYALIYHDYKTEDPNCIVVPKVSLQIANCLRARGSKSYTHGCRQQNSLWLRFSLSWSPFFTRVLERENTLNMCS